MVKVSQFFLKELMSTLLSKILEYSEKGYAEKKFTFYIEGKLVRVEIIAVGPKEQPQQSLRILTSDC